MMKIARTNMTAAVLCCPAFGPGSPRHINGSVQASAAVFTVTNRNHSGRGSLREAIIAANAAGAASAIEFTAIRSQQTINLTSAPAVKNGSPCAFQRCFPLIAVERTLIGDRAHLKAVAGSKN